MKELGVKLEEPIRAMFSVGGQRLELIRAEF